ncbi:MAG: hypothetical protein IID16_10235 [Candidatus Marinimicrobia bacterium]|nr:hypothetical protein [Candidatus Neomarinimicrobiota bacterium]
MKYFNPILSVVFILSVAFAPIIAQEEEEATSQEDANTEEEAVQEEAAVEEEAVVEEEAAAEAVEEAVEEEVEMAVEEEAVEEIAEAEEAEGALSQLGGFTVGLNFGIPIFAGEFLSGVSGTNFGILVGSPYGLPLGPLSLGVGAEILIYDFPDADYSGIAILGTANIGLNNMLPPTFPAIVALQVGGGLFGEGIGVTLGASVDIPIANLPVGIKIYGRGNATSKGGDTQEKATGWANLGAMAIYSF